MKVTHKETVSSYRITFSNKIQDFILKQKRKYDKITIVTDTNVYNYYKSFLQDKDILNIKIKPGERSKSITVKNHIEEQLLKNNFNRKSLIIALGGGVIGDLAGFTASTFMRGIDLIHIPTSLVAVVDSSIGGKTAIDNEYGKNLIGTFYNPKEIIINLDFLNTLPEDEVRQGIAEIIKYSIIEDRKLFLVLQSMKSKFLNNPKKMVEQIIKKCIEIKVKTIKDDFKEGDKRMILNFGHTVGHALEKFHRYTRSHGDCIALGMLIEARISFNMRKLPERDYSDIKKVLRKYALLSLKIRKSDVSKLIDYMRLDKKNSGGKITFSLPKNIGEIHKTQGKHSIQIEDKMITDAISNVIDEIKN